MKAPWTIRSVSGKMFGVQFRLNEMCRYLFNRGYQNPKLKYYL